MRREIVFFIDVDNTLLDNDHIKKEIKKSLIKILGQKEAEHFWLHHDQFREKKKLVDFPNIIREYCKEKHRETCRLLVANIFHSIQFQQALFPKTKKVIEFLKKIGKVIIFSESDDEYQKTKIAKSGLQYLVDEVLLFAHKLDHVDEIVKRYKGNHLIFLDDKGEVLGKIKEKYPNVFTIEVCQGYYCSLDHKAHLKFDKKIYSIAELLNFTPDMFKKASKRRLRSTLALAKLPQNPIITPKTENGWEAWQTFNPGVILLNGKVHFLYRAIGEDSISRLGYAMSADGITLDERLHYPIYEHKTKGRVYTIYSYFSGGSWGGAEDPRIVRVDKEDTLYITYTACDNGLRVALTSIKLQNFLNKKWRWKPPVLISPPGEVHKNWIIFPEKINGKYAVLHSINPEVSIAYRDSLEFNAGEYIESYYNGACRKNCWDTWVRGAGAPPIKTKYGWLLFYHAIDESDPGKYKVGAMLLDINNPMKILHRSQEPILEPEEHYENNGFKAGIVYVSGAVVKNGELLVYYGASDSYVGVAHAPLEEFLGALTKEATPKLKAKILKKKQYDYWTI